MNDDEARAVIRLAGPSTDLGPEPDLDRIIARGRRTRATRTAAKVAGSAVATVTVIVLIASAGTRSGSVEPATPPSEGPLPTIGTEPTVWSSPTSMSTSLVTTTSHGR